MDEDHRDLEELATLARQVSRDSRNLILATARGALFGEQAIRKQYGIIPESMLMQTVPATGQRTR